MFITLEQAYEINGLFSRVIIEENMGRGWSFTAESDARKDLSDYIRPLNVDILQARQISNLVNFALSQGIKLPKNLNLNDYFGG